MELFFPESQSLKARRSHLRPLVDALRARFNASVAETGHQEAWQRATLTVAVAASTESGARETLEAVVRIARERPSMELLDYSVEMA